MLVADPTPVSAVTTLDDLTETANTAQLVSFSDFFTFLLFLLVHLIKLPTVTQLLVWSSSLKKLFFFNPAFLPLENWVIGYFAARTANMVEAFAKEVAIWRLNLTNWPICQAVSGYRWHLGACRPPRHDGGQVQCTIQCSWYMAQLNRRTFSRGHWLAECFNLKGWVLWLLIGTVGKLEVLEASLTRRSTVMIKVIDNVSDNKTNPQVEPGLRPAGAPALRSAEWNIALQSSTPARI